MRMNFLWMLAGVALGWSLAAGEAGIVSNVNVVSDKVEDVSSFEAWKKSVIKDGMPDEQKAQAAWLTTIRMRHHDTSPSEYLCNSPEVIDAFKLFNVYGYCRGTGAQPSLLSLWRNLGFEARGWTIRAWGVPEVKYGNTWHCYDAGMMVYFQKPDGSVPSVEELAASDKAFFDQHKDIYGDVNKIKEFLTKEGIAKGPELLKKSPYMDERGNFPLNYFGWYSYAWCFDGDGKTPFLYEEPYSEGYRVNNQLRKGEKLTRNWGNKGLFLGKEEGAALECVATKTGAGVFYYTPKYGDLGNGRLGNGTLEYTVPLADGSFRGGALLAENLAASSEDKAEGAVHVKDGAKPGVLVIRMPCSYVYLTGTLTLNAKLKDGGSIAVALSDNHGLAWKDVAKIDKAGEQTIDLTKLVYRRYDYRLKFTFTGAGTGLDALKIAHDIQHSQRALPALGKGENSIHASSSAQEGTLSYEGALDEFKDKQVTWTDLGIKLEGLNADTLKQWKTWAPAGVANITLPVETPGDITRLRFGCIYRSGSKDEAWDYQVSFDEGKTFKSVGHTDGPVKLNGKWIAVTEIPKGTRKAWLRFHSEKGMPVMFRCRFDADYAEPNGAFAPVKITYAWDEKGAAKTDVHTLKAADETYKINCAEQPVLKSITIERE